MQVIEAQCSRSWRLTITSISTRSVRCRGGSAMNSSACRAKAWAAVVPGGLPRHYRLVMCISARDRGPVLCAAAVGVQLAQVVGGGGEQPFAAAGAEAAAGHRGHLLAGLELPEH